jgi:hypothetical protein
MRGPKPPTIELTDDERLDNEQILPLLQSVSPDTYWSQRRRQEECEEPHRWLTRLHRDPTQALPKSMSSSIKLSMHGL